MPAPRWAVPRLALLRILPEVGGTQEHWDAVYATRATGDLSWFRSEPVTSLDLLRRWADDGSVLDVGAGTSTLVDRLLDAGFGDVTLLDVSAGALGVVRGRLAGRTAGVSFEVADVLTWEPTRTFDAWHDRAVFHFLIDPAEQRRYVELASTAVAPGGVLVLATFAADGPVTCSGLPTARYAPHDLARLFEPAFTLEHHEREEHVTPWGTVQPFTWVVLRRSRGGPPGPPGRRSRRARSRPPDRPTTTPARRSAPAPPARRPPARRPPG